MVDARVPMQGIVRQHEPTLVAAAAAAAAAGHSYRAARRLADTTKVTLVLVAALAYCNQHTYTTIESNKGELSSGGLG